MFSVISSRYSMYIIIQILYFITIYHEYLSMNTGLRINREQDEKANGSSEYSRQVNKIISRGSFIGYFVEWLLGAIIIGVTTLFIYPNTLLNVVIWSVIVMALFFIRNVLYSTSRNLYVRPRVVKLSNKYKYLMDVKKNAA